MWKQVDGPGSSSTDPEDAYTEEQVFEAVISGEMRESEAIRKLGWTRGKFKGRFHKYEVGRVTVDEAKAYGDSVAPKIPYAGRGECAECAAIHADVEKLEEELSVFRGLILDAMRGIV